MNSVTRNTAEQLQEAFSEFESVSRLLSHSYTTLQQRVARLTDQLAEARQEHAARAADNQRLAARIDNLLDALPGGVVVLDNRGQVQQYNPAARELLGDIAIGDAWSLIVARAFAPRDDDGHDISLTCGRIVNLATQALSGEPGQIVLLRDVTETRRLQDQLAHHKRLSEKTEMAAALAHQVRTPLATALLHARNITRTRDESRRMRAAGRTVTALRRLERLVEDMLLFARGGRIDLEMLPVADVVEAIRSAAEDAGFGGECEFSIARGCDDVAVRANGRALSSIALNLIDNACQSCRETAHARCRDTALRIDARCTDEYLELRFDDAGPGVPAHVASAIFEPFYTTRANGTGLGLPVALAVARAHGGDLTLVPTVCGASFILTVPLAASAAAELTPGVAGRASGETGERRAADANRI